MFWLSVWFSLACIGGFAEMLSFGHVLTVRIVLTVCEMVGVSVVCFGLDFVVWQAFLRQCLIDYRHDTEQAEMLHAWSGSDPPRALWLRLVKGTGATTTGSRCSISCCSLLFFVFDSTESEFLEVRYATCGRFYSGHCGLLITSE